MGMIIKALLLGSPHIANKPIYIYVRTMDTFIFDFAQKIFADESMTISRKIRELALRSSLFKHVALSILVGVLKLNSRISPRVKITSRICRHLYGIYVQNTSAHAP